MVVAKFGSLPMASASSLSVSSAAGDDPTSAAMAACTNAVLAACRVLVPAAAVGTVGMPVKAGLANGALAANNVLTWLCVYASVMP
ncbi:hypothetical protein D3C72_930390 [compost metagenome]